MQRHREGQRAQRRNGAPEPGAETQRDDRLGGEREPAPDDQATSQQQNRDLAFDAHEAPLGLLKSARELRERRGHQQEGSCCATSTSCRAAR